eukprot:538061-Prymnesium_polylepis.1
MAAFVTDMLDDTSLVYSSIEGYVWGVREWHKLQFELDPIRGVAGWDEFMAAIKVLSWVPAEPRKETPIDV